MTTQFVNAVVFASVGFWVGAAVWVVKSAWARVGLLALAGAQVGMNPTEAGELMAEIVAKL